jgi:hypothetical protein
MGPKWCRRTLLLAALAAVGQCGTCAAQLLNQSATDVAAYMAGLRIDRKMLAGPLADERIATVRIGGERQVVAPREVNLVGSAVMVEMARYGPDGQFVRPRVVIGRQSHELRSWMLAAGIQPERCVMPQFRGRLKRDPETGKVGAAVLVQARCTFY